jgi:hypothetical protein
MAVDRRTLVTGGTTLALTAATQAQTPLRAATPAPVRLAALNPVTQAALDKSTWILKKRALASKYNWLKPFAQDLPTDTIIFNTTSALIATQPPYDPYQIETLASSVSALLDRCLTYRQNMYSLDEKATMRALEFELFQTPSSKDGPARKPVNRLRPPHLRRMQASPPELRRDFSSWRRWRAPARPSALPEKPPGKRASTSNGTLWRIISAPFRHATTLPEMR